MATYHLNADDFVIEQYHQTRPFASFLPGIAGMRGIPLWAFYVNRGQAMAGFGVQDKDHPIMEFLPANRAYRTVPLQGFRTFIKLLTRRGETFYEPFQPVLRINGAKDAAGPMQRMRIRMQDLELEEFHPALQLEVRVHYFTIPNEPFAALARVLTIRNCSRQERRLELLDGLPIMIPYGMPDRFLKQMSRTTEAWVSVENVERRAPFYRLKVEPHDRAEVVPIHTGHFYVGCSDAQGAARPLVPIVDPLAIFGLRENFSVPEAFLRRRAFRVPAQQWPSEKTPCAMGFLRTVLPPHQAYQVCSLYGHVENLGRLNGQLATLLDPEFFARKARENRALIQTLTEPMATTSRSRPFDLYCRHTFLDNILRGGQPITLANASEAGPQSVFYVYGRKHGDLERDYNHFVLPATYYSQGNANYRDVNQNRRSDVWFYPDLGDRNIVTFFNLIQLDGFNPLVVKGPRYAVADPAAFPAALRELLAKPWTPGELLQSIERRHIKLTEPPATFLARILATANEVEEAEHSEGFWTDHWTYNLDLVESYLALYPERLRELLLERRVFTFYDNPYIVVPRAQRYRLVHNAVRQLHAVQRDAEKAALIQSRHEAPYTVRTDFGKGSIYATTLIVKMLSLIVNKLASLDPYGMGIEMEADKPNWHDALNGLPALMGSSLCETFELKRWIVWLLSALEHLRLDDAMGLALPEELWGFLTELPDLLNAEAQTYWANSADAKERFRARVRLGLSGKERPLAISELRTFLTKALAKVERGIRRAYDRAQGLYQTYVYYEVTAYDTGGGEPPVMNPAPRLDPALSRKGGADSRGLGEEPSGTATPFLPLDIKDDGRLHVRFSPILPKELFDAQGHFTFRFLGQTTVTYLNPKKRSTFGAGGVGPRTIRLYPRQGQPVVLDGDVIPPPHAELIRRGQIPRIDVVLGSSTQRPPRRPRNSTETRRSP